MKRTLTFYDEAQLVMAAIRLFHHKERRPPRMRELAEYSALSLETVYHVCNRLERLGAVELIRSAFDEGVFLKDPLKAEELRNEVEGPDISQDVMRFKAAQAKRIEEVEKRFSKDHLEQDKKDIFASIEEKLKKGGHEEKESPLDALFGKKPS